MDVCVTFPNPSLEILGPSVIVSREEDGVGGGGGAFGR